MLETRPIAAAASMIGAMAIIGYIDNFIVTIAEDAGIWQFHFIRSLMSIPLFVAIVWLGWGRARPKRLWAVAARSFFLTCALVLYFASLAVLPIEEAVAGLFTSPIFVLLIAVLVQKKKIGPFRIVAVLVGFLGIILVLRPDAGAFSVWTLVPVVAGFLYAISAVATRAWCAEEETITLTVGSFFGLGTAGLVGLIAMFVFPDLARSDGSSFVLHAWESPTPRFLFWTAVQAVGSVGAVFLIVRAYQLGEASYVGVFEYSLLVFVSVWAFLLRGEVVDTAAALGIVLIVVSGTVIALRSRQAA